MDQNQQPPQLSAQPVSYARPTIGLAVTAMVLGIVSVLLSLAWFISVPLAITAVTLGIISLVKKYAGKGMSITGIATGGVTLVVILPFILISVIAYQGISERANEAQQRNETQQRLFR